MQKTQILLNIRSMNFTHPNCQVVFAQSYTCIVEFYLNRVLLIVQKYSSIKIYLQLDLQKASKTA